MLCIVILIMILADYSDRVVIHIVFKANASRHLYLHLYLSYCNASQLILQILIKSTISTIQCIFASWIFHQKGFISFFTVSNGRLMGIPFQDVCLVIIMSFMFWKCSATPLIQKSLLNSSRGWKVKYSHHITLPCCLCFKML